MAKEKRRQQYKLLKALGILYYGVILFAIVVGIWHKVVAISLEDFTSVKTYHSTEEVTKEKTPVEEEEKNPLAGHSTMYIMMSGQEEAVGNCIAEEQTKITNEKIWLDNQNTPSNVEMLEHLCEGEAGDQCDECQQAVVTVVLNRVKSKYFPNTVQSVIFQKGQYACTWDGHYDRTPSEQVKQNVKRVLEGKGIDVPENVVFQSQFPQGSGTWKKIGTETFCYW